MGKSGQADAVGVLVIRAWRDGDRFRARVTSTSDIESRRDEVQVLESKDDVADAVRHWLEDL
jgi:hypothetical protein